MLPGRTAIYHTLFFVLASLILVTALRGPYYPYYPHFTDDNTEAAQGEGTGSATLGWSIEELGQAPRPFLTTAVLN